SPLPCDAARGSSSSPPPPRPHPCPGTQRAPPPRPPRLHPCPRTQWSSPWTFVAFLVALQQNKPLIGDRGLLPCRLYLESVRRYFQGRGAWDAVSYAPTVLWLLDWSHMDANLDALALLGLAVSSFVLLTGCANMVLMAALWVLYMSLVSVGQVW
uniref:Lipase maturation factor 1 n=1 Tax=Suricata suricatta TaxID=37032 RepID=A0A673UFZ2_SURSU